MQRAIFLPFIFVKISLAIIVTMSGESQGADRSLKKQMNFRKVRERGNPLAKEEIISTHSVHSKVECSLKCLQKQTCVGYNYRPKSNTYAVNCQLSNTTQEKDLERNGNGEWTFYQVLNLELKPMEIDTYLLSNYSVTQSGYYNNAYRVKAHALIDGRTDTGGWGSNTGNAGEYIQATYVRPVYVSSVTVAGGKIPFWGSLTSVYGKIDLEYSLDGNTWFMAVKEIQTPMEIKIVVYALTQPITAQYWRLITAEIRWAGTTEFFLKPLIKP